MLHDETRKLLIEAWNKTHNAKEIAERFVEYLKTKLLPPLSEADIIAMDNMRSHHAKAVKQLLDSSKVTYLYLQKAADCCFLYTLRFHESRLNVQS